MGELGWRAKSAQLTREAKPIEGLRDDFGVRVKSALETMRESGTETGGYVPRKGKGRMAALLSQNEGVEARAIKDREDLETDETKEAKRLQALERKAKLYDELQRRVNLDDEAANDLHEVDFIAKALREREDASLQPTSGAPLQLQEFAGTTTQSNDSLHPEEILRQQQAMKVEMQGGEGRRDEYSTYDEDVAHLQSRFQHVDELDDMNAQRAAEFEVSEKKKQEKAERKRKEGDGHKQAILKQLLQKKRRLKT